MEKLYSNRNHSFNRLFHPLLKKKKAIPLQSKEKIVPAVKKSEQFIDFNQIFLIITNSIKKLIYSEEK
jgi:hypothetical protein